MLFLFKNLGHLLYRIWFYIVVALPIVIFSPLLLITTFSERTYPQFFWLARNLWATAVLYGMGCFPRIKREQEMERGKNYVLVANHTSMLDVMLMLRVSKNPFVFVGKKELVNIPVFGFFYKRVSILVDRDSANSRTAVYLRAQRRLKQGLSICIFPEGGVPDESVVLDNFKDGAFRMAIAHQIPIVPMTFKDNKQRFPFSFFKGSPGKMRAKVHSFYETKELAEQDRGKLKEKIRNLILKELEK